MKILKYSVQGMMDVFDPETESVRQVPCMATVEGEEATDANVARAAQIAHNGIYEIVESTAFSLSVHRRLAVIEDVVSVIRRLLALS